MKLTRVLVAVVFGGAVLLLPVPASAQDQPAWEHEDYRRCPFPPTDQTDEPIPVSARDGWDDFDVNGDGFVTETETDELRSAPPLGAVPGQWGEWDANGNGIFEVSEFDADRHVDDSTGYLPDLDDLGAACQDDYLRNWKAAHFEVGAPWFPRVGEPPDGAGPGQFVDAPNGGVVGDIADIPGDIADAAGDVASAPGDFAADQVSKGFDRMVENAADAADTLLIELTTGWTRVSSTVGFGAAEGEASPAGQVQRDLAPITAMLMAIGLIVGLLRMVWTNRFGTLKDPIKSMFYSLVAGAGGISLVYGALQASDALSRMLIERSTDGDLAIGRGFLAAYLASGAAQFAILLFAILAILTSMIMVAMMVVRGLGVTVLAAAAPALAAGDMIAPGTFRRVVGWITALILAKPAAAIVYAVAFRLLQEPTDGDVSLMNIAAGLTLLVLAVAALPAMIRLISPAASIGGPSGAAAAAGLATAAVGGAMLVGSGGAAATAGGAGKAVGGSIGPVGGWKGSMGALPRGATDQLTTGSQRALPPGGGSGSDNGNGSGPPGAKPGGGGAGRQVIDGTAREDGPSRPIGAGTSSGKPPSTSGAKPSATDAARVASDAARATDRSADKFADGPEGAK